MLIKTNIMKITKFKNRELDKRKPIEMYRCLNRKGFTFSLRQEGKVIGHTDNIVLKDCKFIINEGGKERCLSNKTRNVHAFVRGYVGSVDDIQLSFSFDVNYNPYKEQGFYSEMLGKLEKADVVYISREKKMVYCQL